MEDLLEKRKKLICELVEDEKYVPMKEKELAIFMQVKPEDRRELKRILEELLEEGKIEQTKRGRYVRAEKKLLRAVGLYQSSENFGFVVPDNKKLPDIFIPREKKKDAYDGAKVVAEYIESREEGKSPEGEIIEVLGGRDEPGIDMLSVVRALGIPDEFPEKVLNQAQRVSKPVSETDCVMRRDLRAVRMVTIDGEDARDLDDAVSLEEKDGRWLLGVHIADVADYVQENSALDWEAKERGTSVYLPDRVIPMLPKELSNGCCSLNAGEDRLALSCLMEVDKGGTIGNYEIVESVIRVDKRMSYTQVQKILDGDEALWEAYCDEAPMLTEMAKLSKVLRQKRKERGAVDFDFPESKIELDENGEPVEIITRERGEAEMMIEDFMLAANECVARFARENRLPLLYRVHEKPDAEKLAMFADFLDGIGVNAKGIRHNAAPGDIRAILEKTKERPEYSVITALALRSMQKARYDVAPLGHYGLAMADYCHFTSPIRRYPDLVVSRALTAKLTGQPTPLTGEALADAAVRSSERERAAIDAERAADKLMMARLMAHHVGEDYDGTINGVSEYGMYITLSNGAEGFIPVRTLEDWFGFDERRMVLRGERTGTVFSLGQPVRVRVQNVELTQSNIDLTLLTPLKGRTASNHPTQTSDRKRERDRMRSFNR